MSQLVDLAAGINAHVLAPSAGLRNILVHAYLDLDVDRLVVAVPLATDQYGEYVRQVARWVAHRAE